jgi:hypothetical protein
MLGKAEGTSDGLCTWATAWHKCLMKLKGSCTCAIACTMLDDALMKLKGPWMDLHFGHDLAPCWMKLKEPTRDMPLGYCLAQSLMKLKAPWRIDMHLAITWHHALGQWK